jgi:hypothetical protein
MRNKNSLFLSSFLSIFSNRRSGLDLPPTSPPTKRRKRIFALYFSSFSSPFSLKIVAECGETWTFSAAAFAAQHVFLVLAVQLKSVYGEKCFKVPPYEAGRDLGRRLIALYSENFSALAVATFSTQVAQK